jgi:hypothetical protein
LKRVRTCPVRGAATRTPHLDGYFLLHLQSQLRNEVISGDNRVPCVATVCRGCGYLAQHVLDVLDEPEP